MHKPTQPSIALCSAALCGASLLGLLSASGASAAAATDLRIRTTAASVRVGAISTYSVTVFNRGPAATDAPIHVRTALPDGLTFAGVVGTGWTCSTAGASVDCVRADSVDTARSTTFRFRVSVCSAAFPSVTTVFRLDYEADLNGANNAAVKTKVVRAGSCTPPPATPTGRPTLPGPPGTPTSTPTGTPMPTAVPSVADLQLTKTTSSTFTVGGAGLYTLDVANLGPNATNGVITVVDSLPVGLTYVSSSGGAWSCAAAQQTVTCSTTGILASGGSTAVTLTVAVGAAAYPTVTNVAAVSYAGDPTSANNSAQRPTTVRQ